MISEGLSLTISVTWAAIMPCWPLSGAAVPLNEIWPGQPSIPVFRRTDFPLPGYRFYGFTIIHIGPAPDLAADEATFMDQGVGTADRADRHAKIEGEITLRRQLRMVPARRLRSRLRYGLRDAHRLGLSLR